MAPVDPTSGVDSTAPGTTLPDRSSVLALAAALRTSLRFHNQMGIEVYPLTSGLTPSPIKGRKASEPNESSRPAVPVTPPARRAHVQQPRAKVPSGEQLLALQRDIEVCQMCVLGSNRQGVVTGSGTAGSSLLVIGDYSSQDAGFSATTQLGETEDIMLWNMMRAIGLAPADVYVANAVKCCPRSAEQPAVESAQCCRGHLLREIELVRPQVICAMGEWAARSVLGSEESVFRLRGRFHQYRGPGESLQVMVTFHPRLLLKNAELKKAAWQDLQMIQRHLQAL